MNWIEILIRVIRDKQNLSLTSRGHAYGGVVALTKKRKNNDGKI